MASASRTFLTCCGLVLAACAGLPQHAAYPPAGFTHRVASSDVEVYWNCVRPDVNRLEVTGIADTPWAGTIRFVEVEAVSVNDRDQTVTSAKAPTQAVVLHTNEQSPFQIVLPLTGAEARVDLYYQYVPPRGEGFRISGGTPRRFLVHDACSPAQHLAHR